MITVTMTDDEASALCWLAFLYGEAVASGTGPENGPDVELVRLASNRLAEAA